MALNTEHQLLGSPAALQGNEEMEALSAHTLPEPAAVGGRAGTGMKARTPESML